MLVTAVALIFLAKLPKSSRVLFKVPQEGYFVLVDILVENQLCVVYFSGQNKLVEARVSSPSYA